jgi:hypothetical protein
MISASVTSGRLRDAAGRLTAWEDCPMLRLIVCGLMLTAFGTAARAGELDRETAPPSTGVAKGAPATTAVAVGSEMDTESPSQSHFWRGRWGGWYGPGYGWGWGGYYPFRVSVGWGWGGYPGYGWGWGYPGYYGYRGWYGGYYPAYSAWGWGGWGWRGWGGWW